MYFYYVLSTLLTLVQVYIDYILSALLTPVQAYIHLYMVCTPNALVQVYIHNILRLFFFFFASYHSWLRCLYAVYITEDPKSCQVVTGCNSATGECQYGLKNCNDNNPCTADTCINGTCYNTPICSDNGLPECVHSVCNTVCEYIASILCVYVCCLLLTSFTFYQRHIHYYIRLNDFYFALPKTYTLLYFV